MYIAFNNYVFLRYLSVIKHLTLYCGVRVYVITAYTNGVFVHDSDIINLNGNYHEFVDKSQMAAIFQCWHVLLRRYPWLTIPWQYALSHESCELFTLCGITFGRVMLVCVKNTWQLYYIDFWTLAMNVVFFISSLILILFLCLYRSIEISYLVRATY